MVISKKELDLVSKVAEKDSWTDYAIERKSDKEFDLRICGMKSTYSFVSWFPLSVIRSVDWTRLANYSDYPEMVSDGDWSGIRDSSEESIWKMFNIVKSELERN